MTFKQAAIGALAIAILAFCAGRFATPAKVTVHEVEKVVFKDRIVTDKNRDLESHTKKTQLPDGTVITETDKKVKDKTHTDENQDVTTTREFTKVTENRPGWRLGVLYVPDFRQLNYGGYRTTFTLERRLFGEVYMGINAATDKQVGVSISIGF